MFSKLQRIALSVLSVSSVVFGRPVEENERPAPIRVRVVVRNTPPAACDISACTARTVVVSGTATATAEGLARTVTVGSFPKSGNTLGDYGSCSIPKIEFGAGFDNHTETRFQPADKVSYNHNSADNITVIADFICDTLANECHADATAQATCKMAQVAAAAKPPEQGIDADAFNAVFGIVTNFKDVQAIGKTGAMVAGMTSDTSSPSSRAASPSSTASVPLPSSAVPLPSSATSAPASSGISSSEHAVQPSTSITTQPSKSTTNITVSPSTSPSKSGGASEGSSANDSDNLQPFNGSLGGLPAPVVTATGNQFQVEGDQLFNRKQDALTRSCDIQHNNCADAANRSGNKGEFTVGACDDQQKSCKAGN